LFAAGVSRFFPFVRGPTCGMKAKPFNLATVVDPSRLPLLLRRFRLAYIKAGCRQDWRVDEPLRQLSGETPEKSDDVGRILIAESPSEPPWP
jgi:hypothetical protein